MTVLVLSDVLLPCGDFLQGLSMRRRSRIVCRLNTCLPVTLPRGVKMEEQLHPGRVMAHTLMVFFLISSLLHSSTPCSKNVNSTLPLIVSQELLIVGSSSAQTSTALRI